jgi:hypothetical protein
MEANQVGFKERRLEQGDRDLERAGGDRPFNQGRLEPSRQQGQQGGWGHNNNNQQSSWVQHN